MDAAAAWAMAALPHSLAMEATMTITSPEITSVMASEASTTRFSCLCNEALETSVEAQESKLNFFVFA